MLARGRRKERPQTHRMLGPPRPTSVCILSEFTQSFLSPPSPPPPSPAVAAAASAAVFIATAFAAAAATVVATAAAVAAAVAATVAAVPHSLHPTPLTTHPQWVGPASATRVEGREGEGERGERDQGGEGGTARCGALMRCAGRIPGRAEPNAAVRAPWPTWARGTCRPLPPRAPVGCLRVSKIISNMCSILMSGYQTKAYHLTSRSEVFLSPGRVSALQGAGNMIRKPPNQAASAHRGLRSRSHWGVG